VRQAPGTEALDIEPAPTHPTRPRTTTS